jgi:hypothetical protein
MDFDQALKGRQKTRTIVDGGSKSALVVTQLSASKRLRAVTTNGIPVALSGLVGFCCTSFQGLAPLAIGFRPCGAIDSCLCGAFLRSVVSDV